MLIETLFTISQVNGYGCMAYPMICIQSIQNLQFGTLYSASISFNSSTSHSVNVKCSDIHDSWSEIKLTIFFFDVERRIPFSLNSTAANIALSVGLYIFFPSFIAFVHCFHSYNHTYYWLTFGFILLYVPVIYYLDTTFTPPYNLLEATTNINGKREKNAAATWTLTHTKWKSNGMWKKKCCVYKVHS